MSAPAILTFGCRLNHQESQAIRDMGAGRDDLLVVNSCAVTGEAVRQARQAIRRARRERPQARIVVTGCAAQIDPAAFEAMPEVDHVVGNAEKLVPSTWNTLGPASHRRLVGDIATAAPSGAVPTGAFPDRVRGFVQVQNGCDHSCTFCIIPSGRGRSRSVDPDVAVAQVRSLVEAGHREVVLTGVDLTSYAAGAAGDVRLGDLVRRILREVPDLPRLRLSSIDSVEADPALMAALAEEERLMPHLHLSLQSGDDLILKRMKRRHDRRAAIRFCEEARRLRPDVVFGADLIAGFPTESEAMLQASLDLIEQCGIVHLHAFPFSPRPGTPAARMPQLPVETIRARAARLRTAGAASLRAFLDTRVGSVATVLGERGGLARTAQFVAVRPDVALEPGEMASIRLCGHDGTVMRGERLAAAA